jgi:DNA-binding MarR family transcriptional regulator
MAKRTKKRDTAGEGNEELIAGVPLRRVQEFLCRHEHSDWFDFDWVDARRLARDQDEPERSRTVERLAREMLARGWIEKVASRAAARRYRLTQEGRRYTAESRQLFKWPAAQSRIRPAHRSYGIGREWFDCLKHLHQELSRLKLNPEREVSLAVTIRFSGM